MMFLLYYLGEQQKHFVIIVIDFHDLVQLNRYFIFHLTRIKWTRTLKHTRRSNTIQTVLFRSACKSAQPGQFNPFWSLYSSKVHLCAAGKRTRSKRLRRCAIELYLNRNVRKHTFEYMHPSEDSDQPAHSRSLIRIFTGRILDSQVSKVSSCGQWRLRSDCTDAQADLSLRWAHVSGGPFSRVAVHLYVCLIGTFVVTDLLIL